MAKLRRKLRLALNLYETTNSNRLKTGDPLTCELYPAGVEIQDTTTINGGNGVTTTFAVSGRGAIPTGTMIRIYRIDGSGIYQDIAGNDLEFTTIEEQGGNEGVFNLTVTNQGATSPAIAPGDKVLCHRTASGSTPISPSAGNLATLYEDESDDTDSSLTGSPVHPVDVPENGVVECYVDWRGLDVYVSGSTIDDNWMAFNVPTGTGETGPLRLKAESLAADTAVNIDADTSVAIFTSNTNTVAAIEHCAPGRLLILYAATSGVQLSVTSTKGDNTIYEAAPRTLSVTQDAPLMLLGHEGSANVAYWAPVSQPIQFDLALNEISDVDTGGAVGGEVLGYNSGTGKWEPLSDLGTATDPLTSIHVTDLGLKVTNGSGFDAIFGSALLTADRTISVPDTSGALVLTAGTSLISGLKSFAAGASGFRLYDPTVTTKIADFDLSAISSGTTLTFAFPNTAGTFALTSDLPTSINSLPDVTITGAATEDLLKWNGSAWVNSKSVGSNANRIVSLVLDGSSGVGTGLQVSNGSYTGAFQTRVLTASHTANREHFLPNASGTMLQDNTNLKHLTVCLPFDGTTTGLFNMLSTHNAVQLLELNAIGPWAGQYSTFTVTQVSYQWLFDASVTVASPLQLMVYGDTAIPTAATVPPSGATTLMASNIVVPTSGTTASGVIDGWETTGNSLSGILGEHSIFLSVAAGTNGPNQSGQLMLTIEYLVTTGNVTGSTQFGY